MSLREYPQLARRSANAVIHYASAVEGAPAVEGEGLGLEGFGGVLASAYGYTPGVYTVTYIELERVYIDGSTFQK